MTIHTIQKEIDSQHFNPHHREGGDGKITEKQNICTISIHTTAKVVTDPFYLFGNQHPDFNPHHREGGDSKNAQIS